MGNSDDTRSTNALIVAFLEHRKVLAAYLSQRLLRVEDVEDILQETIANALQVEDPSLIRAPKSYFFIVARNLVSRQLQANAKEMLHEIEDMDLNAIPGDYISLEQQIDGQLQFRAFVKAVSQLPAQCRKVFLLRKIYGWPHKKIASRLGISISTVERHITIALSRLDASLRRHDMPSTILDSTISKPLKGVK